MTDQRVAIVTVVGICPHFTNSQLERMPNGCPHPDCADHKVTAVYPVVVPASSKGA